MKIPLNLPLPRGRQSFKARMPASFIIHGGDFLFPPFSKGGKGGFLDKRELRIQFNNKAKSTLTFAFRKLRARLTLNYFSCYENCKL